MSRKVGEGFEKTASGLLLPKDAPQPVVERAEFAVQVRGFAPAEDRRTPMSGDHKRKRMVAYDG